MTTHPLMAAACLGILDDLEAIEHEPLRRRGRQLGEDLHDLPALAERPRRARSGLAVRRGSRHGQLVAADAGGARSGASSYPFTGAGESKTQGLVVAPPLTSTDDDTDLLLTALGEAVTSPT
ncbi:hypothetical protein [Streptomyces sp. NPDC004435]|uniref:hypothetical protein n=1 Tax=Streptomyces sp. NPDC004435 TaxID=3364701 RepID=UPI0036AC284F